jgi:hypothetical protein
MTNFLIFLAIMLVLGGAVFLFRFTANRKKAGVFTTLAQQRGWQYVEQDPQLPARFTGEPFGVGTEQLARHIVAGQHRGRPIMAFDYTYVMDHGTSTESSRYTYKWSVVAVTAPGLSPQAFTARGQRVTNGYLLMWQEGLQDPARAIAMLDAACDALDRLPPQFWSK